MKLPSVIGGKRKALFIRLVLNGMAQGGLTIATGLLIKNAFDRFIAGSADTFGQAGMLIAGGLLAAVLLTSFLRLQEKVDSEKMGQDYVHRIRISLFRHLISIAPRSLNRRTKGSIVLRFVGDLNSLRRWVSLGLARIIVSGVVIAGALAALFTVNVVIALGLSGVILTGVLYAVLLGKSIREAVLESRRRRTHLAANVNEKVSTMAVVQAFNQEQREQKRIRRQSSRLKRAMVAKAGKIGLMRAGTHGTVALASGVTVMLGAIEVSAGRATPGIIVAAITIAGLLIPAIRDLGRVYEYWHEAGVATMKIRQFFSLPSLVNEKKGARALASGPGHLEFRSVTLGSHLRNVSVHAEGGAKIALIGRNGAGKSTLLALAARLLDPDKGSILIDSQDIRSCSLSSLRRSIGIVSPDLPLLRGTIRKNITYRWPDAPEEEIRRVCALCGVDDLIAEKEGEGRIRIIEKGENLSLGQRQRIALARSILGNPSILLLDEADTHLDDATLKLYDNLLSFYRGTVLFVSHSTERILRADSVWKLDRGLLIETGRPERIVASYMENERNYSLA